MIEVDLIRWGDSLYDSACEIAKKNYQQELRVNLKSFPPVFLSMKEGGEIVGSVGFLRGDKADQLLVEKYCEIEGIDLASHFTALGVSSRSEIGEVCCLNVVPFYRKSVPILFSLVQDYISSEGVKAALLTQALSIRRIFRDLGMSVEILCFPDIAKCRRVLDDPEEWAAVYFRLKPACTIVDISKSQKSHHERMAQNPGLLPPFRIGENLSKALGSGAA